ncbi:MAG TPA: ABC transporter ATP-binding protein [Allosphingosinicella sp.]|uniref:ABC transporter ATP-binding protein n=1 Tax=Allosphingosinicella sp. TaxID=2823234 RepID=UPI002EDAAD45
MKEPLLEGRGLSLGRRLKPTSLSVEAGELVCLIGPNGSGKTSLLHALAGVGEAKGTVRIDGADPRPLPPASRQRLFTYLPATRDIKWPLLAGDLMKLGLPGGCQTGGVTAALALERLLDRRVDQLSTGERSRVLIARALAPLPKLLLLDEPAANLDPLWQLKLMDHLRSLVRESGRAALIAMHDLDLARRYGTRVIVMDEGGIIADDAPKPLYAGAAIRQVFGIEKREGEWRPA